MAVPWSPLHFLRMDLRALPPSVPVAVTRHLHVFSSAMVSALVQSWTSSIVAPDACGVRGLSTPTRIATSVRHVRRDQKRPDPTESDTAPAGSY